MPSSTRPHIRCCCSADRRGSAPKGSTTVTTVEWRRHVDGPDVRHRSRAGEGQRDPPRDRRRQPGLGANACEMLERTKARTPTGRLVTMDDVADAAVFSCSRTAPSTAPTSPSTPGGFSCDPIPPRPASGLRPTEPPPHPRSALERFSHGRVGRGARTVSHTASRSARSTRRARRHAPARRRVAGGPQLTDGTDVRARGWNECGLVPVGVPHAWNNEGDGDAVWIAVNSPVRPRPVRPTGHVLGPATRRPTAPASRSTSATRDSILLPPRRRRDGRRQPQDRRRRGRPDGVGQHGDGGCSPTAGSPSRCSWTSALGLVLHQMFMVEYQPGAAPRPPVRGPNHAVLEGDGRRRRRGVHAPRGDGFWTGVGCVHAFYNRRPGPGAVPRDAVAPLPPANYSYRFSRDAATWRRACSPDLGLRGRQPDWRVARCRALGKEESGRAIARVKNLHSTIVLCRFLTRAIAPAPLLPQRVHRAARQSAAEVGTTKTQVRAAARRQVIPVPARSGTVARGGNGDCFEEPHPALAPVVEGVNAATPVQNSRRRGA